MLPKNPVIVDEATATLQTVGLRAPNRYIKDWFEDNYLPAILDEVQNLAGQRPRVAFDVREEVHAPELPAAAPTVAAIAELLVDHASAPTDDRYSFDTFIVGPSNQLACAASRAVAEVPAGKYNPLFIYGGNGLGKTHLLRSIGR